MAGKGGKGGGIVEGLFTGTAFFAASNAKTFAGFVSTFLLYSVVLIVGFMLFAWLLKTITGKEMFSVSDIKCPQGSSAVEKCPGTGTPGCLHPSGNCEASLGK
jgi:hypothetical protein